MSIPIVKEVEDRVFKIFKEKATGNNVYHDSTHTQKVVEMAKVIGKAEGLNEEELEIVTIAAWFHDVGYFSDPENHEEESCREAEYFLVKKDYPPHKIDQVKKCILATRMPHKPGSLIEEVLCDADLHHLGLNDFSDRNELYRIELEKTTGKSFNEYQWLQNNADFLLEHKFFTKYALKNFEEQKNENLIEIQKQLRKKIKKKENKELKQEKIFVDKEKVAVRSAAGYRGVETMFRNVMRTHVEFSGMADNKANIMISVNTLLITAIVAILARKLDSNPHLIIPTVILTTFSMVTLIYATLVTRPKVTQGTFTDEDIKQKRANLLFFGNFFNMSLDKFTWGMEETIKDRDYLYGSMIKDFYYLGQVLGQKYRYLRICYTIFMYGLIISVIAFAIAFILYPGKTDLGTILE